MSERSKREAEALHISKDYIFIDFVGKINFWTTFSLVLTALSLVLIFTKGLNYGIDFAGGTEIQVKFAQKVEPADMRGFLEAQGVKNAGVQQFQSGSGSEYMIRMEAIHAATEKEANVELTKVVDKLTQGMRQKFGNMEIRKVDTVGPTVGNQLKRDGVLAMFYSLLLILIYVGLRFDARFAPGAVICLFHDAIVTLGIFSILRLEVNVTILAAILTIIGYSLNDTIVVYDRIRENMKRLHGLTIGQIINKSTNETMARTILTSLTTFLAALALYLFAGGVIENFAFAMGVGIILGTYSSIYVASPFIIWLEKWKGGRTASTVAVAASGGGHKRR